MSIERELRESLSYGSSRPAESTRENSPDIFLPFFFNLFLYYSHFFLILYLVFYTDRYRLLREHENWRRACSRKLQFRSHTPVSTARGSRGFLIKYRKSSSFVRFRTLDIISTESQRNSNRKASDCGCGNASYKFRSDAFTPRTRVNIHARASKIFC